MALNAERAEVAVGRKVERRPDRGRRGSRRGPLVPAPRELVLADMTIPFKVAEEILGESDANGMDLPENLSFDQWKLRVGFLRYAQTGLLFWLGDVLNYGERRYGDTYEQAMELTGYSYEMCRNAKYVAGAIPKARRRAKDGVSWSHHMAVAPLEAAEQDRLLEKAFQENLSLIQLRSEVKALKAISIGDKGEGVASSSEAASSPVGVEGDGKDGFVAKRRISVKVRGMLKDILPLTEEFEKTLEEEVSDPGKHIQNVGELALELQDRLGELTTALSA